ncbi:hypothetical protein F2P81_009134 [Scophthalmus maximus]|uniref:FAS1 domain-containing protein n=1 Tax=Scophthalmus maximus TaxID=52904 RepID=A0A6A4T3Q0_SCOMX|nr:hypothetical protein F2P81_009134 [Scophthalmus maximus]
MNNSVPPPPVAPIDHVYGTLGLIKATTTQQYADMSKLREEIEGKGSFTMFAPSNDAWEQLDPNVRAALESNVNIELYNALHFHMVNRRLLTKDMKDGMTVKSMYNDLGLYINHYSNGIVTVNCARIIHGNQVATNGVVHVIDRVISAVGNTIKDVLDVNDELSSFNAAALASGMMDKLDQSGHYTLFAPTNEAFDKLNPGYLERILGDKAVIAALVNYHLLNSVQCSEAIMAGTVYETAEGSNIEIGCDGDSLTVNGIKMVLKKDIVTSNGVIHLIDQVLIPDSAKEVMELVGESQSTFNDMVSELGLAAAMRPQTEYTLLAPLNAAFTKNACMVRGSKEGSNGALHLMNTLIRPAEETIYKLLISDGRFKIFLSLMETAGLTDLLKQEGSYTIFAPTDDAFDGLSREDFALLKSDLNVLRTILLYHLSNGVFINGGLEGGVTNLLKTFQGNNLQVMSVNNSIHVNSVDVPDSDLMATNGVIHVVKNVLYPGVPDVTKMVNVIEGELPVTKVTKVVEGEPVITKVTRVIGVEPTVTNVVVEGEPVITKVTRVIGAEPTVTRVVVGGEPEITKLTRVIQGDPTITKVTRLIEGAEFDADGKTITGPDFSKITTIHGNPSMIDAESDRITKLIKEGITGKASRRPPDPKPKLNTEHNENNTVYRFF